MLLLANQVRISRQRFDNSPAVLALFNDDHIIVNNEQFVEQNLIQSNLITNITIRGWLMCFAHRTANAIA